MAGARPGSSGESGRVGTKPGPIFTVGLRSLLPPNPCWILFSLWGSIWYSLMAGDERGGAGSEGQEHTRTSSLTIWWGALWLKKERKIIKELGRECDFCPPKPPFRTRERERKKQKVERDRLDKRQGHSNRETQEAENKRGRDRNQQEGERELEMGRRKEWGQALLHTWFELLQSKTYCSSPCIRRCCTSWIILN